MIWPPRRWPDLGEQELAEVAEVLESGMLTMGPKVLEFEAEIARLCEVEHALAVTSGTAALHLAVLAAGLEPGDEVVVPAYTFPATANVVALSGLKPVLVDVDPETMNIDPAQIRVGPRTKLLLGVHLFGRPLPLHELPDVPLLEDAAGALGARYRGRACGGLGIAGCLSFHPRKIVTTGEGGAITTSDDAFADAVRQMRNHGWRSLAPADMPVPGLNYRLSDILCAVGIPQARRLDELLAARTRIADGYTERLAHLPVAAAARRRRRRPRLAGLRAPGRRPRPRARRAARPGDRGADRHLLAAAARRLPRPGRVPGRAARLRAGARAAVPHAPHRRRPRPGGRGT